MLPTCPNLRSAPKKIISDEINMHSGPTIVNIAINELSTISCPEAIRSSNIMLPGTNKDSANKVRIFKIFISSFFSFTYVYLNYQIKEVFSVHRARIQRCPKHIY